jgi:hypothetical protein
LGFHRFFLLSRSSRLLNSSREGIRPELQARSEVSNSLIVAVVCPGSQGDHLVAHLLDGLSHRRERLVHLAP